MSDTPTLRALIEKRLAAHASYCEFNKPRGCDCVDIALLRKALEALLSPAEARPHEAERNGREHELKTWPDYYRYLVDGTKTFEYRRNDRGFQKGDTLWLREWEPTLGRYTGREMRRLVTYVLPVSVEFVVMALATEARVPSERPHETKDDLGLLGNTTKG